MRFERIDLASGEASQAALRQVFEACRLEDDPFGLPMTPGRLRYWLGGGSDGEPVEAWLAADGSGPAGAYFLSMSDRENATRGWAVLRVPPALRRRGTGTALLAHCADRARAAGRPLLKGNYVAGSAGEAFARAAGAAPDIEEVRRAMRVGDGTAELLAGLRAQAEAAAAGYTVTCWSGPTPDADADQMARLYDAMADAPLGDGEEPEQWDAARLREAEERTIAAGADMHQAAARHVASGQLAAMSMVCVDPEAPELGDQGNTVVAREHRGRRLGMLVKAALYQRLVSERPGLRAFVTWNADTNQYMGAINEQLGFAIANRFRGWQLSSAAVPAPRG